MKHELKKKLNKLEVAWMKLSDGTSVKVMRKDDVKKLLRELTYGDYCGVCGGGLSLSRHDD